jgi:hypothetical protein
MEDQPLASWDELRSLAANGATLGSRSRFDVRLTRLNSRALKRSLSKSLLELQTQADVPFALLAYPQGGHSARVREAAREAGYRAAFTTRPGKNAAGTDLFCLRRIEVEDSDGPITFIWKVATGEPVPWWWKPWRPGDVGTRRAARRRRAREEAWSRRSQRKR